MGSSSKPHGTPSTPSLINSLPSMLLPKPLSRALTSTFLRLRSNARLTLITLTCLLLLIFLILQASTTPHHPPPNPLTYSSTIVKDCVHRTPTSAGRTFETVVRGVHVSFVSWTANASLDKDVIQLYTHPAVRIMSKLKRPATLLDVGANIGKVTFPVLAMSQMHTVIAVEPVAANVNLMCMTANLNGWLGNPGFTLLQAAMSDQRGELDIFVPEGREDNAALSSEAATAKVHEPKRSERVSVLVGDDVLSEGGFRPDVIKIDTQGHELHVLKGLKRYLKEARAGQVLVMAESDPKLMRLSGVDPAQIYQLMTIELGYSPYCSLRANVEVEDGKFVVTGDLLTRQTYPPGGCRDLYYFKQPR